MPTISGTIIRLVITANSTIDWPRWRAAVDTPGPGSFALLKRSIIAHIQRNPYGSDEDSLPSPLHENHRPTGPLLNSMSPATSPVASVHSLIVSLARSAAARCDPRHRQRV